MRAVGYCRVSTQEQTEGTSLSVQEEQIRAYAKLKGIDLARIYQDAGVSGNKPLAERPEGGRVMEAVQGPGIEGVIIVKLDRGFRNVLDCLQSVDAWEAHGVALHIIDLGGNSIDTTTPAGRFMLTVLSAVAEMERLMIRDRCNSGRQKKRELGFRVGEIPFGMDLDPGTNRLVENSQEQEVIRLTVDLKSQGYSLSGIAAELNRRRYTTKKGARWTHRQVGRLLKRVA